MKSATVLLGVYAREAKAKILWDWVTTNHDQYFSQSILTQTDYVIVFRVNDTSLTQTLGPELARKWQKLQDSTRGVSGWVDATVPSTKFKQMRSTTTIISAIAGISLLLVVLVLWISCCLVTERTREIGLRKLGINIGNILVQFLIESMILNLIRWIHWSLCQ